MIDIHADDYALTKNTSSDILECMQKGKLNSISIVPNSACFDECMEMLYSAIPSLPFLPCMSVHINLVEGLCLTDSGFGKYMDFSWGKLFLYSYILPPRNNIRTGIRKEISAQIKKCKSAIDKCLEIAAENNVRCSQRNLRLDSHQHTHHLPIVWKSITSVVREEKYDIEYIRCSREPLSVFLSDTGLFTSYRPVNAVKNMILAMYSGKIDRYCQEKGLRKMYLWGLLMSGKMDHSRVSRLKGSMEKKAVANGRDLEILFHPGIALSDEIGKEINPEAAKEFYLSSNRTLEKDAVLRFQNRSGKG
ncbi:MAG: ChbG/HpnK family deacetylase [Lachnospiraceae bacterium]|nr:ChbG/HpnK family deacetylase [Lachnospiraceae bacterium]